MSGEDYDTDVVDFLPLDNPSTTNLRGHSKKLFKQRAANTLRRNTFSILIVKLWNSLSEDIACIVNAPSVNSFKNKIDAFLENQEMYYDDYNMYKAEISIATTYQQT